MTNQETIQALQDLKDNLYQNLAIYHERITVLVELTKFEIGENEVKFIAKIIKPLDKEEASINRMFLYMKSLNSIEFSSDYFLGEYKLVEGSKLGMPYCPFRLWLDPELTKFVHENDDEITRNIPPLILWSKDWRVLK
jgi:hypothetical protein